MSINHLGLVQGVQVVSGGGEHLAGLMGQGGDQTGVMFQLNGPGYGHLLGLRSALCIKSNLLGGSGVQGQGKGQQLRGIKAVNDYIGLATCQSKIYKK